MRRAASHALARCASLTLRGCMEAGANTTGCTALPVRTATAAAVPTILSRVATCARPPSSWARQVQRCSCARSMSTLQEKSSPRKAAKRGGHKHVAEGATLLTGTEEPRRQEDKQVDRDENLARLEELVTRGQKAPLHLYRSLLWSVAGELTATEKLSVREAERCVPLLRTLPNIPLRGFLPLRQWVQRVLPTLLSPLQRYKRYDAILELLTWAHGRGLHLPYPMVANVCWALVRGRNAELLNGAFGLLLDLAYVPKKDLAVAVLRHMRYCSRPELAIDLFQRLQGLRGTAGRDVKLFMPLRKAALRAAAASENDPDAAVELLERLHEDAVRDDEHPLSCDHHVLVINLYMERGQDFDRALRTYRLMMAEPGTSVGFRFCQRFVQRLFKCGRVDDAHECFVQLLDRGAPLNVIDFTTAIDRLSKHGKRDCAMSLLQRMQTLGIKPDKPFNNMMVSELIRHGDLDIAVANYTDEDGQTHALSTEGLTALMKALIADDRLDQALVLFSTMRDDRGPQPDTSACNEVLYGLGKARRIRELRELYKQMPGFGCRHDSLSHNLVLHALRCDGSWGEASELYAKLVAGDAELSALAHSIGIMLLYQNGAVEEASSIVRSLSSGPAAQGVAGFTFIIQQLLKHGKPDTAYGVYHLMMEQKVQPDLLTYNMMATWLCDAGQHERAIDMYRELRDSGVQIDAPLYTTFISRFFWGGHADMAWIIIDDCIEAGVAPDTALYTQIITSQGRDNFPAECFKLFGEMRRRGVEPDLKAYKAIILACARSFRKVEAITFLEDMLEAGIEPDADLFNRAHQYLGSEFTERLKRMLPSAQGDADGASAAGAKMGTVTTASQHSNSPASV